jgi:predicted phage baseplate assembly protein
MALPVTVHANVVAASRGETVTSEVLGVGDQAQANQRLALLKKPLTYLPSPAANNPAGIKSTLTVRVDGVRWDEVPTFFGQRPAAEVYIVREDDAGTSSVIFGDGVFGARLPTGAVITASYRFGAGAKSPPVNSLSQLARPVNGLLGTTSPVAPAGGQDAEAPKELRVQAPRSALLLGRAVSMLDMETVAATTPGGRAARAEWRWEGSRQRAVVRIWYIGGAGLEPVVSQRIRAMTVPETPITVGPAIAVPAVLGIDLETDPRRIAADVCDAVRAALLDPATGLLAPENVGIGLALFRSRVFEACLAITGTRAMRALLWNGVPFAPYGVTPGAGSYFDFEQGSLDVTGSTATHG